jgi:hypothetical protein
MSKSSGKGPRSDTESQNKNKRAAAGSPLTKYFLVVLFGASTLSLVVNNRFANTVHLHEGSNAVRSALNNFREKVEEIGGTATATNPPEAVGNDNNNNNNNNNNDDSDSELHDPLQSEKEKFGMTDVDDNNENDDGEDNENGNENDGTQKKEEEEETDNDNNNNNEQEHTIANLNCEAYGGPYNGDAEEMVYWEDIPKDALHMSPFHAEHPQNKKLDGDNGVQPITQFLTFEPDAGGWNNIRMAMGTYMT